MFKCQAMMNCNDRLIVQVSSMIESLLVEHNNEAKQMLKKAFRFV